MAAGEVPKNTTLTGVVMRGFGLTWCHVTERQTALLQREPAEPDHVMCGVQLLVV